MDDQRLSARCITVYPVEIGESTIDLPLGSSIKDVCCRADHSGVALVVQRPLHVLVLVTHHIRVVREDEYFAPEYRSTYLGCVDVPQIGPLYTFSEGTG